MKWKRLGYSSMIYFWVAYYLILYFVFGCSLFLQNMISILHSCMEKSMNLHLSSSLLPAHAVLAWQKNSSEMWIRVVPEPAMKQHCAPFIWVQGGYLFNSCLCTGCRGATPVSAEPLSLLPPWPGCCQGRFSHFCPHSSLLGRILPLLQHVLTVAVLLGLAGPCTGTW